MLHAVRSSSFLQFKAQIKRCSQYVNAEINVNSIRLCSTKQSWYSFLQGIYLISQILFQFDKNGHEHKINEKLEIN